MRVISVCFATLYGVSDELHQALVASRRADAYDLLVDFVGSVLGAVGYMRLISRYGLKGSPENKRC